MADADGQLRSVAAEVHAALREVGLDLATAESLTGGALGAVLTSVSGASATYRGGVVTYATDTKASLLGVAESLLAERGPVDAEVARQMADGVRSLLTSDVGVSLTGVAGPDPQDGKPVGLVFLGVAGRGGIFARELRLHGDRDEIRSAAVHAALVAVIEAVRTS